MIGGASLPLLRLEQGLDRMDDKILDATMASRGLDRYAAAKPPLTPWSRPNKSVHAIQAELSIYHKASTLRPSFQRLWGLTRQSIDSN
jgi:hypothetical protein